MWKPDSLLFCIVVILNLCFREGYGNESEEEVYPNYEYMQIFKGVPAFFEYLLNALEEKPEMLEKNDVTVFKRDIAENNKINKEDKTGQATYDNSKEEQADNCEAETVERNKRKESSEVREPPRTVAYEYGNSILKRGSNNEDKCKAKAKREADNVNIKSSRKDKMLKRKMRKRSIGEGDELYLDFSEPGYKEYEEVVWGNDEGYLGFQDLFELDVQPQEIKEGILMTEKLLEDYNYKRMTSG